MFVTYFTCKLKFKCKAQEAKIRHQQCLSSVLSCFGQPALKYFNCARVCWGMLRWGDYCILRCVEFCWVVVGYGKILEVFDWQFWAVLVLSLVALSVDWFYTVLGFAHLFTVVLRCGDVLVGQYRSEASLTLLWHAMINMSRMAWAKFLWSAIKRFLMDCANGMCHY